MFSFLTPRPARAAATGPFSTRSRVEVCPPSLLEAPETAWQRWLRRAGFGEPVAEDGDGLQRVRQVREEFALTLEDLPGQHADFLRHRLRHIRSMRELWHARPEMYGLIAQHGDQAEAERRIAALNRHFPTRAPRPGLARSLHS